jgi:peptidoglycan/xylan/chitin deacetylase (PgdA/CDA1 family)
MKRVNSIWHDLLPDARFSFEEELFKVYLTFDDGPHPDSTPEILRCLERFNIKASFFVIAAAAEQYSYVVDRIRNNGHTIGNHGFLHKKTLFMNRAKFLTSVRDGKIITESNYFRPPYGRIFPNMVKLLERENIHTVLWSVDMQDYKSDAVKRFEIHRTSFSYRNGDILLMHDHPKRVKNTLVILEKMIADLLQKGCIFEKI